MSRIYLSPPDIGPVEREYVVRALQGGWAAPVGPDLDAFERDLAGLTGWDGAVALSSGTAALHLALLVHGVRPNDEVYVSTFTFAATANAVAYCGASPTFIDASAATWNMNPDLLARALAEGRRANRVPRAVVIVDLYGQCADYDDLVPQCEDLGIAVIEDSAEALGATYGGRPAGTLGDVGVFSFNGNKIMSTSGGGMLITPDPSIADRVRYLATQARQPVAHYEHTEVGFNYRLSNILAALGRAQFSRLPALIRRRREINQRYRSLLANVPEITFMPRRGDGEWNGWLTCVLLDTTATRDAVRSALAAQDIESRPLWKPMHLQPAFSTAGSVVDGTSEHLFDHGLCIPSGSALTDEQVSLIAETISHAVTLLR